MAIRKYIILNLNKRIKQMSLEIILKEKRGTIIDVRSPEEYRGGAVAGSINIPLQEIPHRVDELKNYAQPLVLCCASGGRSGQADQYLNQIGFDCINGGPWTTVNYYQSQQG